MKMLGATLERVDAGAVDIALAFRDDLTQQNGYLHAGVTTAIVDSACGYAALTLTPAGSEVLTVEFKVNLLRPAAGATFIARGRVLKPGRTIIVARGDVFARSDGASSLVATMLATVMRQAPP
jgi:uncharacterized protein (TIGR00369 family)